MYAIRESDKRPFFIKGFGSMWKEDLGVYFTDYRRPGQRGSGLGFAEPGDRITFMDGESYRVTSPDEVLLSSRRKR